MNWIYNPLPNNVFGASEDDKSNIGLDCLIDGGWCVDYGSGCPGYFCFTDDPSCTFLNCPFETGGPCAGYICSGNECADFACESFKCSSSHECGVNACLGYTGSCVQTEPYI